VISRERLTDMVGSGTGSVVGSTGERIGKVAQVFLDDQTGRPEWVTAKAGMFSGESFIPVTQASFNGNDLAVPFAADEIKDAPRGKRRRGAPVRRRRGQAVCVLRSQLRRQRADAGVVHGRRHGGRCGQRRGGQK
jgi:hypothetical protein